jgi:hypothetical protein
MSLRARPAVAASIVAVALPVVSMVGCATKVQAQPTDYTRLLIHASDIGGPEAFTADPPETNLNARSTVAVTFRNPDGSRVIYDSILVAADPAAATRALESRKMVAPQGTVHGLPDPIDIGSGGTTISGPSPDGSKAVTLLLFTESKAFVEMEFDSPPNVVAPQEFIVSVGEQQDAAVKHGLTG